MRIELDASGSLAILSPLKPVVGEKSWLQKMTSGVAAKAAADRSLNMLMANTRATRLAESAFDAAPMGRDAG